MKISMLFTVRSCRAISIDSPLIRDPSIQIKYKLIILRSDDPDLFEHL